MEGRFERHRPDLDAYERRVRQGPCFICKLVSGDPAYVYDHPVVYEDDRTLAFLSRWPTRYGYTLVCPKEHREQVTGDFTPGEYLDLQRVVHRIAEAVREEVGAERMYILSLGSNEGNAHVHWHVAPLPPGVPYGEQQFYALMQETAGALRIPGGEKVALAARIGRRLGQERVEDEGAGQGHAAGGDDDVGGGGGHELAGLYPAPVPDELDRPEDEGQHT